MRLSKPFIYFCVMVGILLLIAGWLTGKFAGTDVAFQSSDGEWARPELRFKGDDFESVAVEFELYRTRCSPSATLQRTTPQPTWRQWDYWFNDYSQPKWRMEYVGAKQTENRYPPQNVKHCANEFSPADQIQAARHRVKRWLQTGA